MSAFGDKPDMTIALRNVCLCPKADRTSLGISIHYKSLPL
jgi:hypothetical protein